MRFSAIAFALSLVRAGAAVAAPGDPRLIQGVLEWPLAYSGGEPVIVVRGDDGRVYYADVMAAQRYVQEALSAGSHLALLGLEGTKPHEIIAVALGSGDAACPSPKPRPSRLAKPFSSSPWVRAGSRRQEVVALAERRKTRFSVRQRTVGGEGRGRMARNRAGGPSGVLDYAAWRR